MDLRFYFIQLIVLNLICSSSNQIYNYEMWKAAASHVDYYMNIKTGEDSQWMSPKDTENDGIWKIWRNDSVLRSLNIYRIPNSKVRLDDNDNLHLYLFKNQTSSLHGPIRINSKHIELDMKFNITKEEKDAYPDKIDKEFKHKSYENHEFEFDLMRHARWLLMLLTYQVYDESPLHSRPPLNINLELDSSTASLFPKIEKDDYFILNIINFVDRISLMGEKAAAWDKPPDWPSEKLFYWDRNGPINWIAASHSILNYKIV